MLLVNVETFDVEFDAVDPKNAMQIAIDFEEASKDFYEDGEKELSHFADKVGLALREYVRVATRLEASPLDKK